MFKYLQKDFEPNLRFPGQHYTLFRQEHKQIMTFMYYLYIYLCTGVKFCTTFILIYVLQCTVLYYPYIDLCTLYCTTYIHINIYLSTGVKFCTPILIYVLQCTVLLTLKVTILK